MVRAHVGRRRPLIRRQSLSPAQQAVSDQDLNRLRDLLNDGHDIDEDNGDGWSCSAAPSTPEPTATPGQANPCTRT
jgi:hypothetical protein